MSRSPDYLLPDRVYASSESISNNHHPDLYLHALYNKSLVSKSWYCKCSCWIFFMFLFDVIDWSVPMGDSSLSDTSLTLGLLPSCLKIRGIATSSSTTHRSIYYASC